MKLILFGLGLVTGGIVLEFLMVVHLLKPSFILSFLAYAISLGGLMLGASVIIQQTSSRRGRREWLRTLEQLYPFV